MNYQPWNTVEKGMLSYRLDSCERVATMTDFSLAHLTVITLAPPQVVDVAARTGYRYVGIRLITATPESPGYSLMKDKRMMLETKARLADTGIGVHDIEFVRFAPETDVESFLPVLEAGAELGARHVISAGYDPDRRRLIDRFGSLCDLAAPFRLTINLEFFPWTHIPNLSEAAGVVAAADRKNSGILVDVLHFDRSGSTTEQLDALPPSRLPFVHLCDAPAEKPTTTEAMIFAARTERLAPGEGGINLQRIMRHMPPGIPVGLEVPMEKLTRERGAMEVARRAREGAARVLAAMERELN
jgi:sugar phosphate isomerase/epimerase